LLRCGKRGLAASAQFSTVGTNGVKKAMKLIAVYHTFNWALRYLSTV